MLYVGMLPKSSRFLIFFLFINVFLLFLRFIYVFLLIFRYHCYPYLTLTLDRWAVLQFDRVDFDCGWILNVSLPYPICDLQRYKTLYLIDNLVLFLINYFFIWSSMYLYFTQNLNNFKKNGLAKKINLNLFRFIFFDLSRESRHWLNVKLKYNLGHFTLLCPKFLIWILFINIFLTLVN